MAGLQVLGLSMLPNYGKSVNSRNTLVRQRYQDVGAIFNIDSAQIRPLQQFYLEVRVPSDLSRDRRQPLDEARKNAIATLVDPMLGELTQLAGNVCQGDASTFSVDHDSGVAGSGEAGRLFAALEGKRAVSL
jgi:hypothetical protein